MRVRLCKKVCETFGVARRHRDEGGMRSVEAAMLRVREQLLLSSRSD